MTKEANQDEDGISAIQAKISENANEIEEYATAAKLNGGIIDYNDAVRIVSARLTDLVKVKDLHSEHAVYAFGTISGEKYLTSFGIWDNAGIKKVISDAADDYMSFLALRNIASVPEYRRIYKPLNQWVTDFLSGKFRPPTTPRGRSGYVDMYRNAVVVREVQILSNFCIDPTRNTANPEPRSGCDAISEALFSIGQGVDYKAVERIWTNREKSYNSVILRKILLEEI